MVRRRQRVSVRLRWNGTVRSVYSLYQVGEEEQRYPTDGEERIVVL